MHVFVDFNVSDPRFVFHNGLEWFCNIVSFIVIIIIDMVNHYKAVVIGGSHKGCFLVLISPSHLYLDESLCTFMTIVVYVYDQT